MVAAEARSGQSRHRRRRARKSPMTLATGRTGVGSFSNSLEGRAAPRPSPPRPKSPESRSPLGRRPYFPLSPPAEGPGVMAPSRTPKPSTGCRTSPRLDHGSAVPTSRPRRPPPPSYPRQRPTPPVPVPASPRAIPHRGATGFGAGGAPTAPAPRATSRDLARPRERLDPPRPNAGWRDCQGGEPDGGVARPARCGRALRRRGPVPRGDVPKARGRG